MCVAEGVVDDVHQVGVVSYDGWVPCLEIEMICEENVSNLMVFRLCTPLASWWPWSS